MNLNIFIIIGIITILSIIIRRSDNKIIENMEPKLTFQQYRANSYRNLLQTVPKFNRLFRKHGSNYTQYFFRKFNNTFRINYQKYETQRAAAIAADEAKAAAEAKATAEAKAAAEARAALDNIFNKTDDTLYKEYKLVNNKTMGDFIPNKEYNTLDEAITNCNNQDGGWGRGSGPATLTRSLRARLCASAAASSNLCLASTSCSRLPGLAASQ